MEGKVDAKKIKREILIRQLEELKKHPVIKDISIFNPAMGQ